MAYSSEIDSNIDNILTIVDKNKGEKKLELLAEYLNHHPNEISLINKLEAEAKKQSNHLYIACAYKYKVRLHTRSIYNDSIESYLDSITNELLLFEKKADKKLSKHTKELYSSLKKDLISRKINIYLHKNKFIHAQKEIKEILEDGTLGDVKPFQSQIYYLLGATYLIAGNAEVALQNFNLANSFFEKEEQDENSSYPYYDISEGIIYANQELKRFEEAINLTDKLLMRIEKDHESKLKKNQEDQYIYNLIRLRAYCTQAYQYTKINDAEKARTFLLEAQKLIRQLPESSIFTELYYQSEAEYHLLTKDYKKAKKYISVLTDKYKADKNLHNSTNYIRTHLTLANILNAEGNKDDAYNLLYDLFEANDSINNTKFASQMMEMQIQYNVDKMRKEAEENRVKLNNLYFMLLISVIIAFSLIAIIYCKSRNELALKRKNRQLHNQYLEIEKHKKQELEVKQKKKTEDTPLAPQDPLDIIVEQLDLYLSESGDYKKPNIKREDVALRIGTNRQYLIEAIRMKRDKTFNEYINTFRVKYAYNLIVTQIDKPISEIYLEAGFLTKGTFNRAFKEAYEMTPSELRNAIK